MRNGMTAAFVAAVLTAGAWAQEPPTAKVETVAVPVRTARINAPILATDAQGRWQFICQAMNYKGTTEFTYERRKVPGAEREYAVFKERDQRPDAEWVVLDLESGKFRIFDLPGFHSGFPIRADSGRVFFFNDFMQVWYYEPADGEIKVLGEISRWVPFTNDRSFYQTRLGLDGAIYATTQSYSGKTALVRIDPEALAWRLYPNVGANRPVGLTYGYYLALGLPWAYVAVGQEHWELIAVNVETGEQRPLAERKGDKARIVVSDDGNGGVSAELIGDGKKEVVWCADGKIVPVVAGAQPPRAAAPRRSKGAQPAGAPELDKERPVSIDGDGVATVWWRPAGDKGPWRSSTFRINRPEPELIESLTALPGGALLGSARQYNGWFRYDPAARKHDYFGRGGPSRAKTCLLDGRVYYAGYPNSTMSVYDPARPWKVLEKPSDPASNPRAIGSFGQGVTEAHYATLLLPGPNGRVYLVGKRERWSTGTGLGYYDIAADKRIGLGQDMKDYEARSAALLPKLNRIVISGRDKAETGQFRLYDLDLKPLKPVTLKAEMKDTGLVQNIGHDSRLLGLVEGEGTDLLYLFDVAKGELVARKDLSKIVAPPATPGQGDWWAQIGGIRTRVAFQRPEDGSWWMLRGRALHRLNVETLELTPVVELDRALELPVWCGGDIYGVIGGELVRITGASLPR
jgi:hypothetical protein